MDLLRVEPVHHQPIPEEHREPCRESTARTAISHPERDGKCQIENPRHKVYLRPEIIPILRLQDGKSHILNEVDRERQDDEKRDPIRLFEAFPRPKANESLAEEDESCRDQCQKIVLPATDLNEKCGQFLRRRLLRHHRHHVRQIDPRNRSRELHIAHVNDRCRRVHRDCCRPTDDAQDDLIRLPEDLIDQSHRKDAKCQPPEGDHELMTPVMIPDPHMEPGKTIIHPREAQDQIQPRLHQRYRERARMMHQEHHHQHRLQHQLHRLHPLQEKKTFMCIDHRAENHRRESDYDIQEEQKENILCLRHLARRHAARKGRIQHRIHRPARDEHHPHHCSVAAKRDGKDILHAHPVLQCEILRIEADHRRRQPEVHDTEVRDERTHQLIEPVLTLPDVMEKDGDIEKAQERLERDIEIAEKYA